MERADLFFRESPCSLVLLSHGVVKLADAEIGCVVREESSLRFLGLKAVDPLARD